MTNKYLEKLAEMESIKKAKKPKLHTTELNKIERVLESTTRPKSLREIIDGKAAKSYKASERSGKGNSVGKALSAMQRHSQTPRSASNYTKQRLR